MLNMQGSREMMSNLKWPTCSGLFIRLVESFLLGANAEMMYVPS